MEISQILINEAELRQVESDNISISSAGSSASTKSGRKVGRKLFSRLKKALTKSQYEFTVGEKFACANISLIPAEEESSFSSGGQVPKMKMNFRSKTGTMTEYRQTLYDLVSDRVSKGEQNWNGQFTSDSPEKRTLHKLKKQAGLSKLESTFIHFEILVEIYCKFDDQLKLKPEVICTQFDKMFSLFLSSSILRDEGYNSLRAIFWNKTKSLVKMVTTQLIEDSNQVVKCLRSVNGCVRILSHLKTKNLPELAEELKMSLEELVYKYLEKADNWLREMFGGGCIAEKLSIAKLLDVCMEVVKILKIRREYWTSVFHGLDICLFEIIYSVWDEELAEILQIVMPLISFGLKPTEVDPLVLPTSLNDSYFIIEESAYKLFMILRDFVAFGNNESMRQVHNKYHTLFVPFVVEWINITYLRNLVRTQIAVNLDDLRPVTKSSRFSSSLVDVASFLLKINDFWDELAWPVPEESYSFVVVIIKNLDRCIRHYGEMIWKRVHELEKTDFEKFEISDKLYVAINNIEEVQRYAENIIQKFNIPKLVSAIKIGDLHKQCFSTLSTFKDNMTQTVHQQVVDIVTSAWLANMEHMFLMLVDNCAETKSIIEFSEQKSKLTTHFSHILTEVRQKLSTKNSTIVCQTLWTNMISSFEMYLESCKRVDSSPLIYQHLQIMLFDLEKVFQHESLKEDLNFHIQTTDCLLKLKAFMRLQGSSSADLEIEYLTIRLREQYNAEKLPTTSQIGRLGVTAKYSQESQKLRVDILHGVFHNEVPPCYVKFQVITRNRNADIVYHYTDYKTSKCQLYEKEFEIELPHEDWTQGGMIRFWIKHHGRLHARTHVLAEAFLPLENIAVVENGEAPDSNSLQKLILTCTTMSISKCDILNVLQNRKSDKLACKFVKRERHRFGISNNIFIQ